MNVHAPRDGTAAGRHGGAAREYLICSRKLYPSLVVSFTLLYIVLYAAGGKQIKFGAPV